MNRPEDLEAHLERSYGVAQQTRELRDPDHRTLLVEIEGVLAAFAQLRRGPCPEAVTGPDPIELQRFYVDQPWIGRGVAQRLMGAVVEEAVRLGARTLWLGTWERNARGIAFYRKSGFHEVGTYVFHVGSDAQTDRLMALPLLPGTAS